MFGLVIKALKLSKNQKGSTMDYILRPAFPKELDGINDLYKKLQLKPIEPSDFVEICEHSGEIIALGRLQKYSSEKAWELSGLYVADQHRKKGIATRLISLLISRTPKTDDIYCQIQSDLSGLALKSGFEKLNNLETLTKEVHDNFQKKSDKETQAFKLNRKKAILP